MLHEVKTSVEIPDALADMLAKKGWVDITEYFKSEYYETVLFASPTGEFGLFIDADNTVDEEGDHRPKYNLMSAGEPLTDEPKENWWFSWCDDLIYDDDLQEVLDWLSKH